MKNKERCGAYARSMGRACCAPAMANGRCRNHGGLSTGPKTYQGRKAIGEATRIRMAAGQRMKALEGFYRWLNTGGRKSLTKPAQRRPSKA